MSRATLSMKLKIHGAIRQRGGGDGDENDVRFFDAFGGGIGEAQAARRHIRPHQLIQAGLVNGDAAVLEEFDLGGVIIDTEDVMAGVGEATASDQADVAGADDGQPHFFSIRISWAVGGRGSRHAEGGQLEVQLFGAHASLGANGAVGRAMIDFLVQFEGEFRLVLDLVQPGQGELGLRHHRGGLMMLDQIFCRR